MGKKTSHRRTSFDQLIAVAAACISVVFLLGFGSQIAEIYRLRSALQIADEGVENLRSERAALEATLTYVRSDEYVMRVAREELNKVQPGDHRVVVITRAAPPATPVPTPTPAGVPVASSNWRSWWNLLFGR